MKSRTVATFIVIFTAALFSAGGTARAWNLETHRQAARIIINYMPAYMKASVSKYQNEYFSGVETEPELYDSLIDRHGKFDRNMYSQYGLQRMMYHLQRIQSFMDKKAAGNVLAFEIGQFVRCSSDLLEPLPAGDEFTPLEISGSRIFFLADFEGDNGKFDFLYNGKAAIKNLPVTLDAVIKQNSDSAIKIYRVYHEERNYKAVDAEATAAYNRMLNFLCNALAAIDKMVVTAHGQPLDFKAILGLDRFGGGSNSTEMKIKGPDKPKAPDVPKPEPPKVDKNK